MSIKQEKLLAKNSVIDGQYRVLFFLKKGDYAESYRVEDQAGNTRFLKLINYNKLHPTQLDDEGNILEIEILKEINHPNLVSYIDSNDVIINSERFAYFVLEFISGETLAERMKREHTLPVFKAKQIIAGVLEGLKHLHNLFNPVIHNDITNFNVMLDLSEEREQPKIIDFGYARYLNQPIKSFNKIGLNPFYQAPETFNKIYSQKSDLYSIGALFYHLLFGLPPWHIDISEYEAKKGDMEERILKERQKPLKLFNIDSGIDEISQKVMTKALFQHPEHRFKSADDFHNALKGEVNLDIDQDQENQSKLSKPAQEKTGDGLGAIAGMKELKDSLKFDVIDLIENPDEYKKHGIGLPNGILLYGPPGCGKTFFAEQFAEEAGYNFIKVFASDLASIYVHGTQEKIGKLFKEAKEQAPTIIYFSELDAMVPDRERVNNQSIGGEVNEFLSQLDNIGNSGVFVIGSSNKPDYIDNAALRAGRLEKWFFIPPPDFEARKAMFKMCLEKRPHDFGLDYDKLAELTENYVSSDIRLLVDETSRKSIQEYRQGFSESSRITMELLEQIIKNQKPTVSLSELEKYEEIRNKIEKNTDDSN